MCSVHTTGMQCNNNYYITVQQGVGGGGGAGMPYLWCDVAHVAVLVCVVGVGNGMPYENHVLNVCLCVGPGPDERENFITTLHYTYTAGRAIVLLSFCHQQCTCAPYLV